MGSIWLCFSECDSGIENVPLGHRIRLKLGQHVREQKKYTNETMLVVLVETKEKQLAQYWIYISYIL